MIQSRILSVTESGSILLFHNDLPNTEEALPFILTELLQKGFEPVRVEDMIYTENYRIDSKGKQIYEPQVTASVMYTGDSYANSAFEKIRQNLTLEQIYTLSTFGKDKAAIIEKTREFLTAAEIAAIQMMSYEDLQEAYGTLVYAAETYGAGGLVSPPEQGVYSAGSGKDEDDGNDGEDGSMDKGEADDGSAAPPADSTPADDPPASEPAPPSEETEYPPMNGDVSAEDEEVTVK